MALIAMIVATTMVAIGSARGWPHTMNNVPMKAASRPSSSLTNSMSWALAAAPRSFCLSSLASGAAAMSIETTITPIASGRF